MSSTRPTHACSAALFVLSLQATGAVAAELETLAVRYDHGAALGSVPAADASADGATVIDLSDGFVPPILAEEPGLGPLGYPPYTNTYRALADEHPEPVGHGAERRNLELFGIFPTFRVLRARMLDHERHMCHAQIDLAPLRTFVGRLSIGQQVPSEPRRAAIATLQAILRCEGLLASRYSAGIFDYATQLALETFQRRHMIVSAGALDATTRSKLLASSLERDFEAVLRALRERVVGATGLIEDGSASAEQVEVVGHRLDSAEFRSLDARGSLVHGAPDLIGRATDAAARALGWTSAEAARAWFERTDAQAFQRLHVALMLPPPPAYHGAHMELRAEIDRGDVWYDPPYRNDGSRRAQPVAQRPTLVLYARTPAMDIPLVRWNTTIGGFQPEQLAGGRIVLRYKNSEPGSYVWRAVIAAPSWLPPDSTPDEELVKRTGDGRYALKQSVFGPGYDSAYGLVLMQHEREQSSSAGGFIYTDTGVRSHGSVNYRSILSGHSHGCHRLFNHLAVRLASFLVAHRQHVHQGMLPARFARRVQFANVQRTLRIHSRGYGYELTPPVPVVISEGTIRGGRKRPIEGSLPLPPDFRF